MKYIKTDYVGCDYITAGKLYQVIRSTGEVYCIYDDNGNYIPVTTKEESAHLGLEGKFELVEKSS